MYIFHIFLYSIKCSSQVFEGKTQLVCKVSMGKTPKALKSLTLNKENTLWETRILEKTKRKSFLQTMWFINIPSMTMENIEKFFDEI